MPARNPDGVQAKQRCFGRNPKRPAQDARRPPRQRSTAGQWGLAETPAPISHVLDQAVQAAPHRRAGPKRLSPDRADCPLSD